MVETREAHGASMANRSAWGVLACAVALVLAGFILILAALGWLGLRLWFLPPQLGFFGLLFALVGTLFVTAGVAGIAISMSMRMYSVSQETPESDGAELARDTATP